MSLRRAGAALNLQTLGVSSCPSASITGKTYLGLYHDDGTDILYLWSYNDGAYDSEAASIAYPSGSIYAGPDYMTACKVPGSQIIAFTASVEGVKYLYAWNYGSSTLLSTGVDNQSMVAATAAHIYCIGEGGQLVRFGLDLSSPTDIGDAFWHQAMWVVSDSAIYSQRDDGGQMLGHHDGSTPADPWSLTSRDLIGDGGNYENLYPGYATTALDTLVRYHALGAGSGGSVTTLNVSSGAETPIWRAGWFGGHAISGVGNDDVVVYNGSSYVRLTLADYSGVEDSCVAPSIEVEQHPVALAVPGAFIPLD